MKDEHKFIFKFLIAQAVVTAIVVFLVENFAKF